MKLPEVSISFVWVVLACGFISLVFIIGNLTFLGLHRHPTDPYKRFSSNEIEEGRQKIIEYGCGGCHIIPGVPGARGRVGPSLAKINEQMFITGKVINDTKGMMEWIQNPQRVSPGSVMPDFGITESEARKITAYLYYTAATRFLFLQNQ